MNRDVVTNLVSDPIGLARALNLCGLAAFDIITGAIGLTQSQVTDVIVPATRSADTVLLLKARITSSSPVTRFQLLKNNVPSLSIDAFNEFNEVLTDCYVPVRSEAVLRFVNLSAVSQPTMTYAIDRLTIPDSVLKVICDVVKEIFIVR